MDAGASAAPDASVVAAASCPSFETTNVRFQDGTIQLLRPVEFEYSKFTIRKESFPILDDVTQLLLRHPELERVEVQGHYPNPPKTYSIRLSHGRAEAVAKYLVEQGIARRRIEARGYGEERPLAPYDTPEGKKLNRRIEIHVLEAPRLSCD